MRVALTGASGTLGQFAAPVLRAAGAEVMALARRPVPGLAHLPFALGERPDLRGVDVLIHAALAHLPGRFRGGEGDDPEGFRRLNLDGTRVLFEAAREAGVRRVIFLSSRAVFDGAPPGSDLAEDRAPCPTTLYGRVKAGGEAALSALAEPGFAPVILRATGVYGAPAPGAPHKWQGLFARFLAGETPAPRRASEVHGADLAAAILLCLDAPAGTYHASDLVLDRHDLLAGVARLTRCTTKLPARDDRPLSLLETARLKGLGWHPGGRARLEAALPGLLAGL